ncbi:MULTISPECIES: UDP-N-acetylglucosamine--undecaprenyl-phosphate N-acetylglucosaminephosphotransferase [unclassified Pseudoalteromonas]|uniref:UDP-N-acetylglucosamine--undecaprenyl-phosphate N-acetylglucosaminephosphotransferase n=1 Tax=Gammaproteobacteria TaxID=1236 RepID=UPI00101EF6A8|nr:MULTISPECIES: UDP-N-acetylglucosamine--undecaprenyl-phosphate N-acetylglucosaminephosphotransferase [unclassified Pseudoalteromonas]MCG9707707.1 UDP-N-acetylglucosamine--undecaprenyl-phosphate N-acetylglucosaminephosphotransferase [Pseudoalteromonas sp. Isolate3]MCP4588075.1 UDP-N-acetylglucosamine--undecaprenyl-phosphate N-acetylglucosaminephosphotransferase [Pseudoalteromonas sp.]RZD21656.1 undecaprenyl-phosphate alpha-N-acetylglucosaminyl 1-phosphate transferase [Pseudoalteromonas sp. MEBi
MTFEFITLMFAFVFSYIIILAITPLAVKFGLVDKPCLRKQHTGTIPLIGGLSIFLAVAISIMAFHPLTVKIVSYLACAAVIVVLGVIDDYRQLGVKIRLGVQVLVALVMIYSSEIYIHNLGNLFLMGDIDLGWFGIIFTVISVIACINAFNMIDGIDGLAGSLSILTLLSVFILMLFSGNYALVYLPLIIVATVLPYLAFNLGIKGHRNKKIFMGDAGSMFIGLSVIWFLMVGTQTTESAFRPVTALWIIGVPLMDMMAIIIRRKRKGLSPFSADRDHLHHIFMRVGFSPRRALSSILFFAIILSGVGILGEVLNVPEWIMLALFLIVFVFYSLALQHCWKVARFLRRKKIDVKK